MKGLGSDNHSGVHPELMQALQNCNVDHAPSYGTDNESFKAIQQFRRHFGEQTEVFFVFNGTAANVLSLGLLCERYHSILCAETSHLHQDECGAPEFFAAKLLTLPSEAGKINLAQIKKSLVRKGDQHFAQVRAISLTQPTELGTCYSLEELREICQWAHENNLFVHIDGARLSQALVHLGCSFKEMTTDLGVDVVSFGGTKNGLMMGEAVLVLNKDLAERSKEKLKYLRKQSAQLPSKTRFIAAQFYEYLRQDLYLRIARHSSAMAEQLYQQLREIPTLTITAPRQSNAVFVKIPKTFIKSLREKCFFYIWDEATYECRLMTSWDTTSQEISDFTSHLKELVSREP